MIEVGVFIRFLNLWFIEVRFWVCCVVYARVRRFWLFGEGVRREMGLLWELSRMWEMSNHLIVSLYLFLWNTMKGLFFRNEVACILQNIGYMLCTDLCSDLRSDLCSNLCSDLFTSFLMNFWLLIWLILDKLAFF